MSAPLVPGSHPVHSKLNIIIPRGEWAVTGSLWQCENTCLVNSKQSGQGPQGSFIVLIAIQEKVNKLQYPIYCWTRCWGEISASRLEDSLAQTPPRSALRHRSCPRVGIWRLLCHWLCPDRRDILSLILVDGRDVLYLGEPLHLVEVANNVHHFFTFDSSWL